MVNVRKDLTGMVFGRLTVIARTEDYTAKCGKSYAQWLCKCECGKELVVAQGSLLRSHTMSCGCLRSDISRDRHITHGDVGTQLYNSWRAMRERCQNENATNYQSYGGRGISVCPEWEDYSSFKNWALSNGYSPGLTIDRIDVNGDYTPSNCRWETRIVQGSNKRNNRNITFNGVTKTLSEWARDIGLHRSSLLNRIDKYGWSLEDALTRPKAHA